MVRGLRPDRAALIYPFVHLENCVEEGTPVSIELIHRAIGRSEWVSQLPAGSLTDLLASPTAFLILQENHPGTDFKHR